MFGIFLYQRCLLHVGRRLAPFAFLLDLIFARRIFLMPFVHQQPCFDSTMLNSELPTFKWSTGQIVVYMSCGSIW
jgi:hypothetical protein